MDLQAGQTFDRYRIDALLGRGGMAVVYRVVHAQLGSFHALKILTISTPSIRERLLQEGRLQASLRHPNIVAVTDVLDVEGQPGLVMEYVDGPSLDRWLHDTRPTLDEAQAMFRGIVAGVQAAHAQGLVHRDLKPANVILMPASGQWVPKVADFGLAKAVIEEGEGLQRTRSGVTMGTPQYMAPEQIRDAKNVDARADIFSLGCILFELVTGRPPFNGPDILSIFNAVASASYTPPDTLVPGLPRPVQDAIAGCLKVDRDQRIPDCRALLEVLAGASLSGVIPLPRPSLGGSHGSETYLPEDGGGGGLQSAVAAAPNLSAAPLSQPSSLPQRSTPPDGTLSPPSAAPVETGGRGKLVVLGLGGLLALGGLGLFGAVGLGVGGYVFFQSRQEAAIAGLSARTGGELVFGEITMRPRGMRLDDVVIHGADGQPVARVDRLTLEGAALDEGRIERARMEGLTIELRREGDGWVLPTNALALLGGEGTGFEVGELSTGPVTLTATDASGTLTTRWQDLQLTDARFGGPELWTAGGMRITSLDVAGLEPVLRAATLSAGDDRVLRGDGLELWVRGRTDGLLDVPAVLSGQVAPWLGGSSTEAAADWYGIDPGLLPVPVDRLEVTGGALRLLDRSNAVKAVEWDLALDRLSAGPVTGDTLPLSFAGRTGEGRVALDGDLRRDGLLRATLSAKYLPLSAMAPYLERSLDELGLAIEGGTLDLRVDAVLKEGVFVAALDGEVAAPAFVADGTVSRKGKRLLTARAEAPIAHETTGDVADPEYAPVNLLLQAFADDLLAPAGGATWERRRVHTTTTTAATTGTRTAPARRAPSDTTQKRAETPIEPAAEPPAEPEAPPEAAAEPPPVIATDEQPAEQPPDPKESKDKLERLNTEVREALNELRLPRR